MRLFDLYCGTIEELKRWGEDYFNYTTQFSLRDREKFQKAVQVMTVFAPGDIRRQETAQFVPSYRQYMDDRVRRTGGQAELVEKIMDLDRMLDEGKWVLTRSIEGGAALDGDLDNMNRFADLNFKMLGLVWNGANELGSGPSSDIGLTAFGKEAVKRMEQVDMVVGRPYLSDAGFEDLLDIAEYSFVASHSSVRVYCNHPRNLTSAQFKEAVRHGGLYGLSLLLWFIDDDDNDSKDYLLRRTYHTLELDGEDVIAQGRDVDGKITCDPGLNAPYGVGRFADHLVGHDIGKAVVQKIFFDNAYRSFKQQVK